MNDTKFEFRIPVKDRRQLDELAAVTGLPAVGLIRLALHRLLAQRDMLLPPKPHAAADGVTMGLDSAFRNGLQCQGRRRSSEHGRR
jgi:hypothetical protein